MEKKFLGEQFGVSLTPRGDKDNHICFTILSEDDGSWFTKDVSASSYWIDDLIEQLQMAKRYMKTQKPDMYDGQQLGFKFKNTQR
jgi:hypothetical protein